MLLSFSSVVVLLSVTLVCPRRILGDSYLQQKPLNDFEEAHRDADVRVAIIGAGIAGASAAFHLRQQFARVFHKISLHITIYELSDDVGGHVKTISPQGFEGTGPKPLELGASTFFADDWCLVEAAHTTNTTLTQKWRPQKWIVNGDELLVDRFCEKNDLKVRLWDWHGVKTTMKWAFSWLAFELRHMFLPWTIRYKLKTLQEQFQQFGKNETFSNTLQELKRCGLHDITMSTASESLERLGMNLDFRQTYIEPCVMDKFGLTLVDALGAHVILSTDTVRANLSVSVLGGNGKFVGRMIEDSGAVVNLNSRVLKVEAGISRQHSLTSISESTSGREQRLEYDAIVATGDTLLNLQTPESRSTQERNVTTYKTHFSTSSRFINSTAIGYHTGSVPRAVLFTNKSTSKTANIRSKLGLTSLVSWPEFYIDRTGCYFDDECDQFSDIHIVRSSHQLSEESLRELTMGYGSIDWFSSHSWVRNVPVMNRSAPILGDIEVEPFLFNAGNTILDTMEMSCRMGRNAALKIMEQLPRAMDIFGADEPWKYLLV